MRQIKPFKQFVIQESEDNLDPDDDLNQLRDLGLADKEPFDKRYQRVLDEWGSDPVINAALEILKKRTGQIIDKFIDRGEDEWSDFMDDLASGEAVYDMGWLEYMIVNDLAD